MKTHEFWAFFIIALIAGASIGLVISNATMNGYFSVPFKISTQQIKPTSINPIACEQAGGICTSSACPAGYVESNLSCTSCKNEGEAIPVIPNSPQCCSGLTLIKPRTSGILGISGICTAKCGDGFCNTTIESNYNCPADCKIGPEPIPISKFPSTQAIAVRQIIPAQQIQPQPAPNKCCVPVVQLQGYLQIATLKKEYSVGEQVNLTDPPEVTANVIKPLMAPVHEPTKAYSQFEGGSYIYRSPEEELYVERMPVSGVPTTEQISEIPILPRYKGWIIQFKEPSVVEYAIALEKGQTLQLPEIKPVQQNIFTRIFQRITGQAIATQQQYKQEIISRQNIAKTNIAQTLKISKPVLEQKVIGEFREVYNGIALDITDAQAQEIKKLPEVKAVYPNYEVQALLNESVPLINVDDVWKLPDPNRYGWNLTGKNVTIAIIDTGIDYTHPDLGGCFGPSCKVIGGWDFVNDDNDPMDDQGHGTHCASIAAGIGTASGGLLKGVAPDAKLYAYKVMNSQGSGSLSDVLSGIERATDPNQDGNFSDHVDVISISLGYQGGSPDGPDAQAVDNAVDAGVVVAVAAGNSGYGILDCPGCARKAITVGASCKPNQIGIYPCFNEVASFSGGGLTLIYTIKPDVVAPGVKICAAEWNDAWNDSRCYSGIGGNYVAISGTSMATPHVAGAAALIKQAHHDWSPDEIKMALRNTAVDLNYDVLTQGYGRIDVLKAINTSKPCSSWLNTSGIIEGIINITGTATCNNFKNYTLYYGEGIKPLNWVPLYSSKTSVSKGILYLNFNSSTLPIGTFILKLEVADTSGKTSEDRTLIIRGIYEKGWPKDISETLTKPITVGDLDNDNFSEIIASIGQTIYVWHYNGSDVDGWPKYVDTKLRETPAIGDIDRDGYGEIVVSSNGGVIYAWHNNGSNVSGWPIYNIPSYYVYSPTLADIDNDRYPDIVVAGATQDCSNNGCKVYVFNGNGSALKGWPQNVDIYSYYSPAVGDLDNDGNNEIIVSGPAYGSSPLLYKIYVFKSNGDLFWTWNTTEVLNSLPVIGDINNDGQLEVVVFADDINLYIFNYNGGLLNNWSIPSGTDGPPALADINGDGNLEIIAEAFDKIVGWDAKGAIDLSTGDISIGEHHIVLSPVVGDVNNDNGADILALTFWRPHIYAYNKNGLLLKNWPKDMVLPPGPMIGCLRINTPTIADIDNDGNIEVVVGKENRIIVWKLDTKYNQSTMEWPMFQHDPQHTGCYGCDKIKPVQKSLINNTGSAPIQGYLLMKVQKKVSGMQPVKPGPNAQAINIPTVQTYYWQDVAIIIKDTTTRTIQPNSYLALDKVWAQAGGWKTSATGDYQIYAALVDSQGKIIETAQGKLESSYEFSVSVKAGASPEPQPAKIPIWQKLFKK